MAGTGKPGKDPMLGDKELLKNIKQCILDGMNLKETAKACGINEDTFYVYHSDNVLGIADKIERWRLDRKLMLAEKNLEAILEIGTGSRETLKTVADITKFTLETLDKANYSKRQENTGEGGGPVEFIIKRGSENL